MICHTMVQGGQDALLEEQMQEPTLTVYAYGAVRCQNAAPQRKLGHHSWGVEHRCVVPSESQGVGQPMGVQRCPAQVRQNAMGHVAAMPSRAKTWGYPNFWISRSKLLQVQSIENRPISV